jgi:hypothetical protein
MTKSKIAVLATVLTVLAAPAFAGDRHTATLRQHSGRHVSQVTVPSGAYAAEFGSARAAGGRALDGFPTDYLTNRFGDRQLQGR